MKEAGGEERLEEDWAVSCPPGGCWTSPWAPGVEDAGWS